MPDEVQQANTPEPVSIPAAAVCLALLCPLVDAQVLFDWRWGALLAAPLLAGYFLFSWGRILLPGRILLLLCVSLGFVVVMRDNGMATLTQALGRMTFFPAFVAMLGLLRAAADASDTAALAGGYLVLQPPARRYAALTFGAHIFGILLNIGGLALLLDMTKRANTLEAGFGEQRVVDLRERRMTLAVMRGFSCIALWSPLGLALNLLLACAPGLAWVDVAPYGLVVAIIFMAMGFVFDRLEFPRATRPLAQASDPRGLTALAKMIGHIVALSTLTLAAELASEKPFQAILINLVPLYAVAWLIANGISRRQGGVLAFAGRSLTQGGLVRWPGYANEIAVFAASGFLGVVLAALAPREALQMAISAAALPAGVISAMLAGTVVVLGFIGVNPMISASILAAVMTQIAVPGLSSAQIVLALAGGWTCVIGVAPLMSSLVMTAGIIGRRSREVGLIWNGRFALASISLWMLALLVLRI